jgi:hypothetical protein
MGVFMATTQAVEPIQAIIEKIVSKTEGIASFWRDAEGWAPDEAAALLSRSRLDRQVSLSRTLVLWIAPSATAQAPDEEGRLILGWANLGSLVEGSLKWFLSVYLADYLADEDAVRTRQGELKDPDALDLERVRTYFARSVWTEADLWDAWILSVQQRRNAIHFYKDRPIGTRDELVAAIRTYWDFLQDLEGRVPYPDEVYRP